MIDPSNDRTLLTPWWHYVSIMGAYTATDQILFEISASTWVLTAGLRLSCLLLVPRRFWGALIAGELMSLATIAIPCASVFGTEWAIAILMPAMAYCIPFVYLSQNHLPIFDRDERVVPLHLLVLVFFFAAASTLRTDITIAAVVMQNGSPPVFVTWYGTYSSFIGTYLGSLTITPCVLAIRERLLRVTQPLTWRQLMKHSLLRDVLVFELPIVTGLLLAAHVLIGGENLNYFRAAMAIPVIVLSLRHGWHGTAVSGMIASIFLRATMLEHKDPTLIPTQTMLALVISAWLLSTRRQPPESRPVEAIHASAWIVILSLVPLHAIRRALSPRYVAPDGTLYDADGRMIGASG